jgi:hypothetical protein
MEYTPKTRRGIQHVPPERAIGNHGDAQREASCADAVGIGSLDILGTSGRFGNLRPSAYDLCLRLRFGGQARLVPIRPANDSCERMPN